ncbi:MAG: helicase-related protein, partial [Nitrospirota bacterium]
AIQITDDNDTKKKLIEVLEKETLIKEISPFEAYALILKTYLDTFKGRDIGQRLIDILGENGYKVYTYQMDAVKQALSIIDQNNGVIIADVVGLGKTVIACAAAFELKKRGIVIAPPGIVGDKDKKSGWKRYLEEFYLSKLGWDAYSVGDLQGIKEAVSRSKDIEVVIIDEAHRFRNQDTRDYEYLKNICRGKRVILLTATPFNNRPADIFSLLKLFIIPKRSTITLGSDLELKFKLFKTDFEKLSYIKRYANSPDTKKRSRASTYYRSLFGKDTVDLNDVKRLSHAIAREIKEVIEPVTIRRNRLDLQQNPCYHNEVKQLSHVEDPVEWFFELTKEQSRFYDSVINEYFALPDEGGKFNGAIYRPFIYEVGDKDLIGDGETLEQEKSFQYTQQFNLYDFMRRLLVKRFESSFGAFRQSLANFKKVTGIVKEFIDKTQKYILDRDLLEKIYDKDVDEIEEYLKEYAEKLKRNEYPKNHKIYKINRFKEKDKFLKDITADFNLFDSILNELDRLDLVKHDPKAESLVKGIKKVIADKPQKGEPRRKIVIFSEYIDTIKYLAPILTKEFNERVLVIIGDLSKTKIESIYKDFDASYPDREDKYDILLSTDKISEGFNLNRAGMLINYDIPWNPVRVIQRVGRINRISKKVFEKLYIVNFFPTERGATLVHSREIAQNKMFLIHNTLGEDAKIFDTDEEPTPSGLYSRLQQNPDSLEGESFYTKVFKEFEKIKKENPNLIKSFDKFPPRIKIAKRGPVCLGTGRKEDELFVIIKKGRLYVYHSKYSEDNNGFAVKALEDVIDKVKAEKDEQGLELSLQFWDIYENVKDFKETAKTRPIPEKSIQQRAINNLKSLLALEGIEELLFHKDFIRMLLEDILDYGTLADYTLRRLANLDFSKASDSIRRNIAQTLQEISKLKKELGEDYLYQEKKRQKNLTKEIIIAVENRKWVDR